MDVRDGCRRIFRLDLVAARLPQSGNACLGEDRRREPKAKESVRDYDFGKERENYDFIWPEQTWETLIELLYELPESWRPYVRERILVKFKEAKEPVTPESIKACWDSVLGDLSV